MNSSSFLRRAVLALPIALLCLGSAIVPGSAMSFGGSGADTVRTLYATLMNSMRNGPALGARGRYAQIEPVVQRVFDIPYMARLEVGPQWTSLSPAQQQQVTQAFTRYVAAIYAERFDSYSGDQ